MVYGIGQRVHRAIFGLAVSVEGSERQFLDTDLKLDSELIGMDSGSQNPLDFQFPHLQETIFHIIVVKLMREPMCNSSLSEGRME